MNFVTGGSGVLGRELVRKLGPGTYAPSRNAFNLEAVQDLPKIETAYLCAGTKGFAECEGNREAFRADVDGNIRLIGDLMKDGAFVVFISTDAVEKVNAAYARNRLLVEQTLWLRPNCAVVRPGKFNEQTVGPLADLCILVGKQRREGVHYWL
jgi:dTDP-4-dehydrorhamnose reductase